MTMKDDGWYSRADASESLTQGDLIPDCPVLVWNEQVTTTDTAESLTSASEIQRADLVVMTQACDLEQGKVKNAILCPHLSLDQYREGWEARRRKQGQVPTEKAWASEFSSVCSGFRWNLAMLNEGRVEDLVTDHRVVEFHEVFSIPRGFLESLLRGRGRPRLRLRPPYREHLSQAFARCFMRVGLPIEVRLPSQSR